MQTNYGDDVFFMSNKELVEYMQNPFDKDGNPVSEDELATPEFTSFINAVGTWSVEADDLGSNATYQVVDGSALDINFTVGQSNEEAGQYCWVDIAGFFTKGALENVSHIDIKYKADEPFRIRLIPDETETSTMSMQVLLAGLGDTRVARIRMKDFRPDPYAEADKILSQDYVDSNYLSKISGISIENAATKDNISYDVEIKALVFHGLNPEDL